MKKTILLLILLTLSLLIAGCGLPDGGDSAGETSAFLPDSSIRLDFSDMHEISNKFQTVYIALTVESVFDEVYDPNGAGTGTSQPCLLVRGKLEKAFFVSDEMLDGARFYEQGTEILLFVSLENVDKGAEDQLKAYLEGADSLIAYGFGRDESDILVSPDSANGRWLSEYFPTKLSPYGEEVLDLPIGLVTDALDCWSIIPIVDGVADCNNFEQVLRDCGISGMLFSFTEGLPERGVYFTDGDQKDDVYAAIERFVSESLSGTLPERKRLNCDGTTA